MRSSEIPLALQPKLLRVLQEGTFERVGEDRARKVDVRVVAATNRDLRQEAEAGRFRSDLYFRLSVFPIFVPPLRDRREDIPALAQNFADASCRKLKRKPLRLAPSDTQRLQSIRLAGQRARAPTRNRARRHPLKGSLARTRVARGAHSDRRSAGSRANYYA